VAPYLCHFHDNTLVLHIRKGVPKDENDPQEKKKKALKIGHYQN
jgi:hypothetical protein